MREFIARLEEKRQSLGLSEGAFADYLGVDRTVWSRARRSETKFSRTVVLAGLSRFPELGFVLPAALRIGNPELQHTA
jgi:transcriptional regulator with XRE-family HTH domain